jgi:hypothetical protein
MNIPKNELSHPTEISPVPEDERTPGVFSEWTVDDHQESLQRLMRAEAGLLNRAARQPLRPQRS